MINKKVNKINEMIINIMLCIMHPAGCYCISLVVLKLLVDMLPEEFVACYKLAKHLLVLHTQERVFYVI